MEGTINERIDDDRIGMIRCETDTLEFMMITKTQAWETSMRVRDFLEVIEDIYAVPVHDVPETVKAMVLFRGFQVEGNILTLTLQHKLYKNGIPVKFPPLSEPRASSSFIWSAVVKSSDSYSNERREEEERRIEEEEKEAKRKLEDLRYQYKRWLKKNPLALTVQVPECYRMLSCK
jgi:hypothetical protein